MADYQIRLVSLEKNFDVTVTCADNQPILEAAEAAGLKMPYSCRSGACSTCAARLMNGDLDQSGQTALTEDEVTAGYVLTCIGFPETNCSLVTHQGPRGRATMPRSTRRRVWPW